MMSFKQTHRTPLKSPASPQLKGTTTTQPSTDILTHLKPQNMIALQRRHGNQALQRILATRRTPNSDVIQPKIISNSRLKKDGKAYLGEFKMSRSKDYNAAISAGMNDNDIVKLLQGFVDSNDEYTYLQVEKAVVAQIGNMLAPTPQNTRETGYGGVNVIENNRSVKIGTGQDIETKGLREDIHSKWMFIEMDFMIESADENVQDWELGFAQTVTSSDRSIVWSDAQDNATMMRMKLPGAKRDGGDDQLMPWFKPESVVSLGKQKIQGVHLAFEDRPGFGVTLDPGEKMSRMRGADTFKLVLMLRKKDGTDEKVLHTWNWRADYDNLAGDSALGITVDTDAPGGNTANMALDGERARNAFATTQQKLTKAQAQLEGGASLPNQAAFKEMKDNAKKKVTISSAMLPVKEYGKLVNEFNVHVNNSDWAKAKTVIDDLRHHLDLMEAKDTKYWRAITLKTRYFKPIYDAVKQQQLFINGKLGG